MRTNQDALNTILDIVDDTEDPAEWRHRLSKMKLDFCYGAEMEHQAADAVSRLPTTGKECKPIGFELQVMIVVSPLTKNVKVCVKTIGVIDDYDDPVFNFSSTLSLALFCIMSSISGTNITAPMLTELSDKQYRNTFW